MMRYLTLNEVLVLYRRIIEETGGTAGILDLGMLESALAQPRQTFGGTELYPTPVEKATALGFSLIKNHPFVDGNKRVGHAAMEVFLVLNGYEIKAPVDEQERVILDVAAGEMSREAFTEWLADHAVERPVK
jgi:death-on-curing protein